MHYHNRTIPLLGSKFLSTNLLYQPPKPTHGVEGTPSYPPKHSRGQNQGCALPKHCFIYECAYYLVIDSAFIKYKIEVPVPPQVQPCVGPKFLCDVWIHIAIPYIMNLGFLSPLWPPELILSKLLYLYVISRAFIKWNFEAPALHGYDPQGAKNLGLSLGSLWSFMVSRPQS